MARFQPHPFHWSPAEGQRHAVAGARPSGDQRSEPVETLCGRQLPAATGDLAWLWETCPECLTEAYRLAGAEPVPERIS